MTSCHISLYLMSLMTKTLPAGVASTLGPDATGVGHVFWYTVESARHSLRELRTLQDWFVRYQLHSRTWSPLLRSVPSSIKSTWIPIDCEPSTSP